MQVLKHAPFLLVVGLVTVIIFASSTAILEINRFEANSVEQTSKQLLGVAKSEAMSLSSFLNDVLEDLHSISLDPNLTSSLDPDAQPVSGPADSRFSSFCLVGRRHSKETAGLYLIGKQGQIVNCFPFDQAAIGRDYSLEPDILYALECRTDNISDPFLTCDGKMPVISITTPVLRNGEYAGLLRRLVPLSNLKADVSGVENAMQGVKVGTYIISDNGHVLHDPGGDLADQDAVTTIVGASGNYDRFIERMKRGEEGRGVEESTSYSGKAKRAEKMIIAFASVRVGTQNWSVGVATPYETVSKPIRMHARAVLIFTGLILISFIAGSIGFYHIQRKRDRIAADLEAVHMLRTMNERLMGEVTERTKAEEALKRAHDELEVRVQQRTADLTTANKVLEQEVNERKRLEVLRDNLIHMVVHDLKSPLCGITGYLDLAVQHGKKTLPANLLYFIQEGLSSAEDLLEMINSLLDVNRMEAGKLPLNKEKSELAALAQRAMVKLSSLAMGKDIKIQSPKDGVWCVCDPDIIYRVILNLLTNAIKYVPESGGKVTISLTSENAHVSLRVVDNGPGIPKQYHEKIFEKFGRVEGQSSGNIYSTGLGLTFCKLAVEAHGGKIGVISDEGKGSTFWVDLPVVHEGRKENRPL
jgi:two-component system sensor histidine kinase/response regulator